MVKIPSASVTDEDAQCVLHPWRYWVLTAIRRAVINVSAAATGAISTAKLMGDVQWCAVASMCGITAIVNILFSLSDMPKISKDI